MVTTKRKKRLIRTGLLLLVLVAGVAYYGLVISEPPWFDVAGDVAEALGDGEESPAVDDSPWGEAIAATAEAGIAEIDVTVRAVMPEEMADGKTRRRFSGEGSLDLAASLSSVEYGMNKVPNSAGYFGHVPGKLDVVYSDSGFAATFPLMARALSGEEEWLFYDLDVLSNPRAIQLGIGQLREIALSDPRLAFELLRGAEDDDAAAIGGSITIDLDKAIEGSVHDGLREMMTTMRDLVRVTVEEAEVTVGEEGRIEQISYAFTYPTAFKDIRLNVDLDVLGPDGLPVEEPEESMVKDYSEQLQL